MDQEAIRARFERIKERALKKADEERAVLGRIDTAAQSSPDEYTIARWPRRPPRAPKISTLFVALVLAHSRPPLGIVDAHPDLGPRAKRRVGGRMDRARLSNRSAIAR